MIQGVRTTHGRTTENPFGDHTMVVFYFLFFLWIPFQGTVWTPLCRGSGLALSASLGTFFSFFFLHHLDRIQTVLKLCEFPPDSAAPLPPSYLYADSKLTLFARWITWRRRAELVLNMLYGFNAGLLALSYVLSLSLSLLPDITHSLLDPDPPFLTQP